MLTIICIDEIHQFIELGITFRGKEFISLKHLISSLMHNLSSRFSHMDVPILCMTATFNKPLMGLLSHMIRFDFTPSNILFCAPTMSKFAKWHISIEANYCHQVLPASSTVRVASLITCRENCFHSVSWTALVQEFDKIRIAGVFEFQ